jgi:hypothetical protein
VWALFQMAAAPCLMVPICINRVHYATLTWRMTFGINSVHVRASRSQNPGKMAYNTKERRGAAI